jgi:tetratricopeptide (TPR) repeat protein
MRHSPLTLLSKGALCGLALMFTLLARPLGAQNQQADAHFKSAMSHYKARNPKEALAELELALKATPQNDTSDSKKSTAFLLYWIGFIHLENQQYKLAQEPLEKAVKLEPNNVVAHMNLGNVYDGLSLYAKAQGEFETVIKLEPEKADAYYNLGLIFTKKKQWANAVEALRKAARCDLVAVNAAKKEPPKPGQPVLKEDPYIHDALGLALQNTGELPGAIGEYQKAAALDPGSADFNYHLGWTWRLMAEQGKGDRDNALRNARKALALAVEKAPASYEIREIYAETLFDMKLYSEATTQFVKAAELDKTQYSPLYNLGVAYSLLNSPVAAERAYSGALAVLKPGDDSLRRRDAMNGLGLALYKQGKHAQAVETLKQVTKDFPTDSTAWINLAASQRGKGDEAGEIEALKGAISNSPNSPNIAQLHAALGALYYKRGDNENALDQYNQSNELKPNNPETLNGLGLVEQRKGNIEGALKNFMAAIRINPQFADAYNNLGVAYEARKGKGDADLAYTSYEKALTINPNHALAKQNKERFDKVKKENKK